MNNYTQPRLTLDLVRRAIALGVTDAKGLAAYIRGVR